MTKNRVQLTRLLPISREEIDNLVGYIVIPFANIVGLDSNCCASMASPLLLRIRTPIPVSNSTELAKESLFHLIQYSRFQACLEDLISL